MNPRRGRLGAESTGVLGCVGGAGDRIDEGASDRKKERKKVLPAASELIGGETRVQADGGKDLEDVPGHGITYKRSNTNW